MDRRQVIFGSLILLAAALNFAFFVGDLSDPSVHDVRVLFAALLVNLIATGLEVRDRTQVGAVYLAASLVVTVQMVAAVLVWAYAGRPALGGGEVTPEVLSLSGGALMASVVSVVVLFYQTVVDEMLRR